MVNSLVTKGNELSNTKISTEDLSFIIHRLDECSKINGIKFCTVGIYRPLGFLGNNERFSANISS